MARHLTQITNPCAEYLCNRFTFKSQGRRQSHDHELHPALELARIQGESLLIQRFFKFLSIRRIEDAQTQLYFWRQFYEGAEVFNQFCINSHLLQTFKSQTDLAFQNQFSQQQIQYIAYCCLIWDLHINKNKSLLYSVTDKLFTHYLASIYPSLPTQKNNEQVKREICKQLALKWHLRPELKESFKIDKESVEFTLIAKVAGCHPVSLITITGNRLKTTRAKAYQALLIKAESGVFDRPKQRIAKKSEPMRPLM